MRMVLGSISLTAEVLMILSIANGPMNLCPSFLDSTRKGRSRVDSHTL